MLPRKSSRDFLERGSRSRPRWLPPVLRSPGDDEPGRSGAAQRRKRGLQERGFRNSRGRGRGSCYGARHVAERLHFAAWARTQLHCRLGVCLPWLLSKVRMRAAPDPPVTRTCAKFRREPNHPERNVAPNNGATNLRTSRFARRTAVNKLFNELSRCIQTRIIYLEPSSSDANVLYLSIGFADRGSRSESIRTESGPSDARSRETV